MDSRSLNVPAVRKVPRMSMRRLMAGAGRRYRFPPHPPLARSSDRPFFLNSKQPAPARRRVPAVIAVTFVLALLQAFLLMRSVTASADGDLLAQMGPPDAGDMPAGAPPNHSAHHGGDAGPRADSAPGAAPPPEENGLGMAPAAPAVPGGGAAIGGMGMGGMMSPSQPVLSPGPGKAGAGGCGGMMGCMGGGTKPFYPALMDMPSLTPEARRFIETEANKRLGVGSEAITLGQISLHHALSANDPPAIRQAVAGVREGVLQVESGAAARLALDEGQRPRQIALSWFKDQMSTLVAADGTMGENGPWGLSWYHLAIMLFLIAFLLAAILIHFTRARRIGQLVRQLTPTGSVAPQTGSSTAAPAPPAPASPPTAAGATPPVPAAGAVASGTTSKQPPGPSKAWSSKLRVAAIFQETPDVKSFRLMEQDGGAIPFTFLPGQFLTFAADLDGKPIRRSYTIASSPAQRDYIEITVKREEQGAESRYLHDNVAVGDLLEVSGPSGVFTFTGKEARSVVLIAGGVGITPMMCAIRYLTDCAYPGDIFFLYGARSPQNFIFCEELEYLQKRHKNLHVVATMERLEGASWTGAVGNISKEFIAHAVPEIARRRVHVCGPPAMMEAVKAELDALGVTRGQIKTEAFGPALGAALAPAAATPTPASLASFPAGPDAAFAPAPEAGLAAAVPAVPSAQAQVQFIKSGKTGVLAPDKCVLEAAEAIGVAIDFSCRVGTCGICVVPLIKGSVTMAVEEGLPPAEKARGMILACQAKSTGNLVVDA